eukprot:3392535-Pleurochrysis_carterae.AAC.1
MAFRPGTGATFTKAMANAGINMRAIAQVAQATRKRPREATTHAGSLCRSTSLAQHAAANSSEAGTLFVSGFRYRI